MKAILNRLFQREKLSRQEAKDVIFDIGQGKYNLAQVSAFISVFCLRSITVDELDGFREAMLDLCLSVPLEANDYIDLCGTGGDGKDTFNISTLASFVTAGAGYKVAKHGNYGVSSVCGSSNVMDFLGFKFTDDISLLKRQFDKHNICFLHAPLFHPAMKVVGPIRKDLSVKTFFNMLGPLINPARPNCQSVGVFSLELARMYNYVCQKRGGKFSVVFDLGGYDEVSLTDSVKLYNNKGEFLVHSSDFTNLSVSANEILGGKDIESSAKIFTSVLTNKCTAPQKEVVLVNAALAIGTIASDKKFQECYSLAKDSLESGKALQCFKGLLG